MSIVELTEKPNLHQPILLVSFVGWGDASQSASGAVRYLCDNWAAPQVGEIGGEEFYDFTATRPWVRLNERGEREIRWPKMRLFAHQSEGKGPDVLLMRGRQPSLRWRTFSQGVVDLARELQVSTVVVLGAFPARIAHTSVPSLNGWAWPRELSRRLEAVDVNENRHEGPAGLQTVLAAACAEAQIPVTSLRAWVPFYLDNVVNPTGSLALLDVLNRTLGLGCPLGELTQASENFIQFVNERLVQMGTTTREIIANARGNAQTDTIFSPDQPPTTTTPMSEQPELPSPEDAVRQIEEFLRNDKES